MTWIVQQATPVGGATPQSASLTGVSSAHELVVIVVGTIGTSGQTISSVEETTTSTALTNVVPFTVGAAGSGGPYIGYGVWKLDSPPASPSITVTASSGNVAVFVIESSITGLALDVAAPPVSSSNSTYTTESISSSFSNELWIAVAATAYGGGYTYSGWTNGFVSGNNYHGSTSPNCNWAWVQEASAVTQDVSVVLSSQTAASLILWALKTSASQPFPVISSVNGSNPIDEGATGVSIAGTEFSSPLSVSITQGSNSVAQAAPTYVSSTSATFNLAMEPVVGAQLAFTDATYPTSLTITTPVGTSTPISVTLAPRAGNLFQTVQSTNQASYYRIETLPDLAVGDQIEASGNSTGTAAAPTGLVLNPDGTFQFTNGAWVNFWVRVYKASDSAWTPWAEIVCTGLAQADGFD